MDPSMIRVEAIPQDVRRKVLDYVTQVKGVKPSELGYDKTYMYRVRHGLVPISDDLFRALLRFIDVEEYARLVGSAPPLVDATPDDVIRVIKKALVDRSFRNLLFDMLRQAFGEEFREYRTSWVVTERDIEEFIRAKRLKGVSEKTIRDEVHYIREALAELGWNLTPDGIREYLAELAEEGEEYVLKHTTYSLKSFLKTVLKPRDPALFRALYDAFTVYRPKSNNKARLPSIEQLRQIWQQLPTIEAKFYFALLAETGLRPGEPFLLSVDDLDLEHGMIRIGKVTATKRAFIAFLRPEFLEWVRQVYLPHRQAWVEKMARAWEASNLFGQDVVENAKRKLIPFDQSRLRREIKEVARQVLGREFELYELRKFFATWMVSQGVPESIVNTLQGRAPPSEFRVLIEHYWSPRHEELRQWYIKFAPRVCC
ncbi:MAG: site-specific integrase [Vulcanisaeta sp.]|nr:site-specific integrase [Vulcanisaeta sp.]